MKYGVRFTRATNGTLFVTRTVKSGDKQNSPYITLKDDGGKAVSFPIVDQDVARIVADYTYNTVDGEATSAYVDQG